MKNSVALLIAARAELAVHDNRDVIVSNLCRTFDIRPDDAIAVIAAAQLLADQPGRDDPLRVIDEIPVQPRLVADQAT